MVGHYTRKEKDVKFAGKLAGEIWQIEKRTLQNNETIGYGRSGGNLPSSPEERLRREHDFHGSIRVNDLPASVRFYAWLLNTWPKEWTHRYATFVESDLNLNFVLLVSDGKTLHQDTLYHLGIGVADRDTVIDAYHNALAFSAHIEKPPRTTWKGTPLHELWLTDPDGTLIEIYARLTDSELAEKPADELPVFLVPGTGPESS